MPTLTNLKLTNMLSHKNTDIPIAPCVTIFAGDSRSGKSVIVRALYQAMLNKPNGINLLSHGVKHGACAETLMTFMDYDGSMFEVARRRSKSRNEYDLTGEDNPLKAFKLEPPVCISDKLNLSCFAFKRQQDKDFLLCETDGAVARILGQTVGLTQIDGAFKYMRKIKGENDELLLNAKKDVAINDAQILKFSTLDAVNKIVAEAEAKGSAHDALNEVCDATTFAINTGEVIPSDVNTSVATAAVELLDKRSKEKMGIDNKVKLLEMNCDILARIHDDVSTEEAKLAVEAFQDANSECDILKRNCSEMYTRGMVLAAIPEDVSVVEADRAINALGLMETKESWICNQVERLQIAITQGESIPADVGDLCAEATVSIAVVEVANIALIKLRSERDAIKALLDDYRGINTDCMVGARELKEATTAMETYKENNPVCPNCGATPDHWNQTIKDALTVAL